MADAKITFVADESADVVALWRLQSTYADIVTRRAWAELETVFSPDVTIEVDTVTSDAYHFVGPAEFIDFVSAATDRFDHFEFVILNPVVEVDGDSARGRIFMCEIRHETATDEWTTAYGLYQDTYRRADGRWLITARHYRSLARTGANQGIFGIPAGLELFGR
jgi:SnoaL-like domain